MSKSRDTCGDLTRPVSQAVYQQRRGRGAPAVCSDCLALSVQPVSPNNSSCLQNHYSVTYPKRTMWLWYRDCRKVCGAVGRSSTYSGWTIGQLADRVFNPCNVPNMPGGVRYFTVRWPNVATLAIIIICFAHGNGSCDLSTGPSKPPFYTPRWSWLDKRGTVIDRPITRFVAGPC